MDTIDTATADDWMPMTDVLWIIDHTNPTPGALADYRMDLSRQRAVAGLTPVPTNLCVDCEMMSPATAATCQGCGETVFMDVDQLLKTLKQMEESPNMWE